MESNDCKVCKQLIKEKHRREIWWKVFCIIFGALALILGILYFSSGKMVKETQIELTDSTFQNSGDNGTIIVGGDNNAVGTMTSGTMTENDYTPIICISIVVGVAILVVGGVLIANHSKRND